MSKSKMQTKSMKKYEFYREIEAGELQGANRYREYWFVYQNIKGGQKVLELGGGHTRLSWTLAEKGCTIYVTEIDQGPYMHHHNLAKIHKNYNAIKVRDETLPFASSSFDVVYTASSIEHFDPDNNGDMKAISEAFRVLKPGGLFIITIPVYKEYISNRYAGHPIHPPEKIYNEDEYKKRFLELFKEEKVEYWKWSEKKPTGFVPHPHWIQRKGIVNTEKVDKFEDANGLCAVLKSKKE